MAYFLVAIKTIVTILAFCVAASIASGGFQNIVVAGIGIVYVTTNVGLVSMRFQNTQNLLLMTQMFSSLSENIPNFKEQVDPDQSAKVLNKANNNVAKMAILNTIDIGSNFLVLLGCLYLIVVSV